MPFFEVNLLSLDLEFPNIEFELLLLFPFGCSYLQGLKSSWEQEQTGIFLLLQKN